MGRFGIPTVGYLQKAFFFTHLIGMAAGLLIYLSLLVLLAPTPLPLPFPFLLLCLGIGFGAGAASFLFVRGTLKKQLRQQMDLLGPLIGTIRVKDSTDNSVESLLAVLETSVGWLDDLIKTILATVDDLLPRYRSLAEGARYLAKRAKAGLAAADEARQDVQVLEEKQRAVMQQMQALTDRSQDEAAISRQLSASLEEMAKAMEHSSANFLETTSTVEEMAASVREVAAQAEEIAHSVEGTAQDLDTIGEALEKIRSGADAGARAAATVQEDADQGLSVVEASMAEMARIEEESRRANEAMERLNRQTDEVETIIQVIKELVSDTELLAFNAAIIAAQAGDEGKGFSVVAEEIRDLADRTSSSAQDIHRIIQAIGNETRQVMTAVASTAKSIADGRQVFQSTGGALRKIVESARLAAESSREIARLTEGEGKRARSLLHEAGRSLRSVQAIARAMKEQETGTVRIQEGVEEMKAAADHIARGMEEQLRANQAFDRGLSEREDQIRSASEATRLQMTVTEHVVAHFNTSQERLRGNVDRAQVLSGEVADVEKLTGLLREMADRVNRRATPTLGSTGAPACPSGNSAPVSPGGCS